VNKFCVANPILSVQWLPVFYQFVKVLFLISEPYQGFDIKFMEMGDTPFYKRPWFYITTWLVVLLMAYSWEIISLGGIPVNIVRIFVDIVCIFPILLLLWMTFFSQFVLPVRTFSDRQSIFNRLIARLFGRSGPAIFIRNGELVKREGEERKKSPGVLWLDSASGAVTRTPVRIKQTLGPGVHFIDGKEYIAGIVDLHIQSQSIGPREADKPFEPKNETLTDEAYLQIQDRRKQVSALTRDGIEVIPNISVSFRVNTGFPAEGKPGSRFGYRTGITPKDKQNEKEDQVAIRKAILGEGINPNVPLDSPRHRIAWNQLPALLAVDVWREYVAKYTLDELFTPSQEVPPEVPPPLQPTEEEVDPLSQPIQVGGGNDSLQNALARMLRQINLFMARQTLWLEGKKDNVPQSPTSPPLTPKPSPEKKAPPLRTALQVINEMVKARLTQPKVVFLDNIGKRDVNHVPISSREYELLQDRGLKVLSVGISNPRFSPKVEKEIINHWEADWLANALAEKEQIDRRRSYIETSGQEQAIRQYADSLSQAVLKEKPNGVKATLKVLLMRSRLIIIRNDQLRRKMSTEQQELEDIIRWIEVNGP